MGLCRVRPVKRGYYSPGTTSPLYLRKSELVQRYSAKCRQVESMARMKISNQEWEVLKTRIKNNKQIELAEQELARRKKMADIEKLQYYASDLAYSLDIGEIADMWVDTENGKQVLRMRVIPKKHDEFKTIRSEPKSNRGRERKPAPNTRNTYKPVNASPKFDPGLDDGFGEKAARIGVNFGKSVVGWIRTPPKRKPEDW